MIGVTGSSGVGNSVPLHRRTAVEHEALRQRVRILIRGRRPEHAHRFGQAFELDLAVLVQADPVDGAREMHDALAHEHFAGLRLRAEPRGEVERAAAIAAVDGDGLARVEADADEQRNRRVELHLVRKRDLQIHCRAKRFAGGERNTASASSPRNSITSPSWSSTPSRAISANFAARRAAASSPRDCV